MYILAIDQSTAGTKALVFDADGCVVSRVDKTHRQITNEQGWVEHNPLEIWRNTVDVARLTLEKSAVPLDKISAVAITNQRETAVCWDRKTGQPVSNAIVWQCGRATAITDRLSSNGVAPLIRQRTGLHLSPYFSAAKFAWLLENIPAASQLLAEGNLCCGNIDAWLLFNMTDGKAFKTDYSNASRTQLLNLDTLDWDDDVLRLFGLNRQAMPELGMSDRYFGETTLDGLFSHSVPIRAMLGDSHAALFANNCLQPYTAKATFGTGTSVMMNIGSKRQSPARDSVVESLAWGIEGEIPYVLEGNINYSGAIIRWLVDDIHLIDQSRQSGELASSVDSTNGVYLVPAFTGLGAPYWDNDARAAFVGMSRATRREHLVRAAEEAIAYQIRDIIEELNACCPQPLENLAVDGGATHDRFLMQFVADMLNVPIQIASIEELSAAGTAYAAALAAGITTRTRLFDKPCSTPIQPAMDPDKRAQFYTGWKNAVNMIRTNSQEE